MRGRELKRIAIATSMAELPAGDRELMAALAEEGIEAEPVIWSSPDHRERQFDAVVVRSCWDYHLRVEEFLDWISGLEHRSVPVMNPPAMIRWNANKSYLAELAASGIAIPETIFLQEQMEVDVAEMCRSHGWEAAVVKPLVSASAHRTERRSEGTVRGPAMVQEYVGAIETEGEWSLVYIHGRFSHAVIKKAKPGDFRVQSDFGGTVQTSQPPAELMDFGEQVMSRLKWPSVFARVDVVRDRPRVVLMEFELIEPELFLDLAPGSSRLLAAAIRDWVKGGDISHCKGGPV